jgi:hypothetical protein
MFDSKCRPEDEIAVLSSIAHLFYLTSLQVRRLVGLYKKEAHRAEFLVTLFNRIVDMYNSKLFRVLFESQSECLRLHQRLGFASFFPFWQPENSQFELDLACNDQRICAHVYVALAAKERLSNVVKPRILRLDGAVQDFPQGVPSGWKERSNVPKEGRFCGHYVCAPEYRKFEWRTKLAETFGFFTVVVEEDQVKWCTGLNEPPSDIIKFLEFLLVQFPSADAAFHALAARGGKEMTRRDFEEGLMAKGCLKFEGPDKKHRQDTIFRYLDPGGEGSVSQDEFTVIDQLWHEVDLTIREFVRFLCLTFGDDLELAWKWLVSFGSADGELTSEEWGRAVKQAGYFGPSRVVFGLLDESEDGNISREEFQALEKYKSEVI